MSYTLQKECKIVLIYKGTGYLFDALTQFDFNQTFNRSSGSRKTLHSKKAKPYTYANSKNSATFSFGVLGTKSFSEGVLFELAGLTKLHANVYEYGDELGISPEFCDIFIVTKAGTHKVTKAAVQSLEVSLALSEPLAFDVSFTASSIKRVSGIDLSSGLIEQGEPLLPTPIQYRINNILNNSVINAGISLQQSIDWRADRGLHDIGNLYVPKHAVLTDRSYGMNVNTYLNTKYPTPEEAYYANLELYKSGLYLSLGDALVTHRVAPADVFTEAQDVTITDKTNKIIVEYGGYLI
ncbi:minor tail protein [Vibrio phage Achelous]|uniref:Minor tail protein n=2 Tax=Thalassavirus TaxID=2948922 RepID=A0A4Y6E7M0_9CAUD|nr:base plate tail tube protein [Vibrio phage Achelous]YP_010102459.1 base plate tail tube protein [Vibrio phage Brizo]QCQ57621.1 minor tail protein [Vibrio phage Achelous]QDF14437.1 minor tail protein [Vibrio phage Brizo]